MTQNGVQFEENFQIDPHICSCLPDVIGMYGMYEETYFGSYVSVCEKGSMDTSLWIKFIEDTILSCYSRMSKEMI